MGDVTQSELADWQRRCDAATPWPWSAVFAPDTDTNVICGVADHDFEYIARTDVHSIHSTDDCEANAAFIAVARSAMPRLIMEVHRLAMELHCAQIQVEDRGNSYRAMTTERDALAARCEDEHMQLTDAIDDMFGLQPPTRTLAENIAAIRENVNERSRQYEAMRAERDVAASSCQQNSTWMFHARNAAADANSDLTALRAELATVKKENEAMRSKLLEIRDQYPNLLARVERDTAEKIAAYCDDVWSIETGNDVRNGAWKEKP